MFLLALTLGGQERYTLHIASGLDSRRFRVHVAYAADGPLRDGFEQAGIPLFQYRKWTGGDTTAEGRRELFGSPAAFGRSLWTVLQYIRDHGIGVVTAADADGYLVGGLAAILSGRHLVKLQGGVPSLTEPTLYRWMRWNPVAWGTDAFQSNVVYGRELMAKGIPMRKLVEIIGGVETERFHPSLDGKAFRRRYAIPEDAIVVGQLGRLVASKRFDIMLHAAREVLVSGREAYFLIGGYGFLRDDLERLAGDLGVADRVTFTGRIYDQTSAIAAMDIGVFTMDAPVGGTFPLEVMACGKALVSTSSERWPQIHATSQCARLVEPGNVGAVAKAIIELIDDSATRARLAAAGRAHVEKFYDFNRNVVPGLAHLFSSLVEGNAQNSNHGSPPGRAP